MEISGHPYQPADLELPGFVPNFLSQSTLLGVYGGASLLTVILVWIVSGRFTKALKFDRVLMCWWAFTGLTHLILESYFVFTPDFYKDTTGAFLAEVWKEYSKGDSRYAGRDAGVITVEGLTAVIEGPACLLAIYAIATKKSYRYVLQLAISLGQLYGCAVYYITGYLDGDHFAMNMYYYYIYYIGANASWVVIPTLISIHCWKKICSAFEHQKTGKAKTR